VGDAQVTHPLFPFYGSKWRDARRYPAPGDLVIEPFAGSAGYSLWHAPARVELYDVDPIVVGVWSYLLRVTPRELLALPDLEPGQSTDDLALPQEARWLIGFWLNRGSATPKKTQTAYSRRTDRAQLVWSQRARERLASEVESVRHWRVEQRSYQNVPLREDATYFVDPPYVEKGRYYRCNHVDHAAVGAWVRALPGRAVVCENVGADWLPFRPLASIKSTRGRSDEAVYTQGYPAGRINLAAFAV
jgi:site-specific DNA-adenine methylase